MSHGLGEGEDRCRAEAGAGPVDEVGDLAARWALKGDGAAVVVQGFLVAVEGPAAMGAWEEEEEMEVGEEVRPGGRKVRPVTAEWWPEQAGQSAGRCETSMKRCATPLCLGQVGEQHTEHQPPYCYSSQNTHLDMLLCITTNSTSSRCIAWPHWGGHPTAPVYRATSAQLHRLHTQTPWPAGPFFTPAPAPAPAPVPGPAQGGPRSGPAVATRVSSGESAIACTLPRCACQLCSVEAFGEQRSGQRGFGSKQQTINNQ